MKNTILAFAVSLTMASHVSAQVTTATNFTANDCAGNAHELFAEMNAGKVVVMAWVMPCATCSGPAITAYNVVQSFASSHPGKVLFYVVDDYGNTACPTLTNWANAEIVTGLTVFSDAAISMSDYGSEGMPKIVVAGGQNHTVYFNKNNSSSNDAAGVETAINAALSDILAVPNVADLDDVKWSWNSTNKTGVLHFNANATGTLEYTVFNLLGQAVLPSQSQTSNIGKQEISVDAKQLPLGTYFLRVNFNGGTSTFKISVQ